tara:strand:+ start:852 stop:1184 length:333 start_codon:yes stop_codon:yes gene_type:complete
MAVVWNITNLEYNNDSNKGVVHAFWTCLESETVGSGDDAVVHTGSLYGRVSYVPDASKSGYIAYDDLTEAKVRSWVKATLGSDEVTRIETQVAAQITQSKTPSTTTGVPW